MPTSKIDPTQIVSICTQCKFYVSLEGNISYLFFCLQTDLLVAAAKTGKIVNIKKGQFCAPSVSYHVLLTIFTIYGNFSACLNIEYTFLLMVMVKFLIRCLCRSWPTLQKKLDWLEIKMLWFVKEEPCLDTVSRYKLIFSLVGRDLLENRNVLDTYLNLPLSSCSCR